MVENVLKNYHPLDWNGSNKDTEYPNYYQEMDIDSLGLRMAMMGTFCNKIKRITRVENPYLYGCFLLKQAEYKCKGIPFSINELYHDTGDHKVDSILKTNLDWRLVTRQKFGKGVSFSSSTKYANKQSTWSNGTDRAMIVADVLCGNLQKGNFITTLPGDGYDTTVGNCFNVYVKFYDNEFYPKYVIHYDSIIHAKAKRYRH